ASSKQIEDINILIKTGVFDTIPDNLKEIALMRKNNPEMSLREMSEELGGKISKSGISHRFKKISNLADAAKRGKQ
ncbi:MAG: DNA-binding protein WhiA, partial [Oscillospiraceae bacterium]|nr:DNA-binding protein WhiA [Oscillospiraceae bacterium]